MTRKYSLVIEGSADSYSAYVPELPTILVTGRSLEELTARASEAIRIYWETVSADRSPSSTIREIEVELPA
ncbi:MAG TPA: type II toxin-antitoxin system HicB family antitoxin [Bryobacteraceae bacterium]|nr:type II toxin-antitoxin system HicB family antitoxin [Bryobacteraceae bacterium]